MVRWALILFAMSAWASAAFADAIRPFDGACPPGLSSAIRNHREVCVPQVCAADSDCPTGASCVITFDCWGTAPGETSIRRLGSCDAEGHCAEGTCREQRQCEPRDATPAWNASEHRWTEVPYVAPSCTAHPRARGVSGGSLLALMVALAGARVLRRGAPRPFGP